MTTKTNKQKCLGMWKWLTENPNKNKCNYREFLQNQIRLKEYNYCWACKEAYNLTIATISSICHLCPIQWTKSINHHCEETISPYFIWNNATNITIRQNAAQQIVQLIKETWKE